MITATRRRHATEEERRRGLGPMVGIEVQYDLDRREVMTALKKAIFEDASPVTWDDYRALDAGRPVLEEALKYAIGDQALEKSLANPAAAEPERGREYESIELVCVEPGVPLVRSERATLWVEGGRRELQRRLLAAIARGDQRVSATDVAGLDDGGRIRKGALMAVLGADEELGDWSDADLTSGEPLAKSRRPSKAEVALEFLQGLGRSADIDVTALRKSLSDHGYKVSDEEARNLARMLGPRRVTCNTTKTDCRVR